MPFRWETSARAAITRRYLAVLMPLFFLFTVALESFLRHELDEERAIDLRREARLVLRFSRDALASSPSRAEASARITSALAFLGAPTSIRDEHGVLALSPGEPEVAAVASAPGARRIRRTESGLEVTVFAVPDARDHTIAEFRFSAVIALAVTFVVAWGTGYFVASSALRPVDAIDRAVREIDARSLGTRLVPRAVPDELGRLVQTLNGMLERIERSLTASRRFTQDASHELKTPIAAIKGTAEVALRSGTLEPEPARAFQAIGREVERLERIVRDLLSMARADARAPLEKTERFDLRALAQETAEVGEALAADRGTKIHLAVPDAEVPIVADALHLSEVGLNLVDNALRYGRAGGNIWVSVARDGATAVFSVADDGEGIPEADREHVFERFFRRHHDQDGVGLGLAIVRAIVERHQGTIAALGRPGGGALFEVRIPIAG